MKSKSVIIGILIVLNIPLVKSQTASELWNQTFVSTILKSPGISYSLTVDGTSYGDTFDKDTVCHVTSTPAAMWHTDGFDGLENLYITRDSFLLFNRLADDIVCGSTWKDSTHTEHSSEYNLLIYPNKVAWGMIPIYLPLYFAQWNYSSDKRTPESYHDTVWNGSRYWVFLVVDHSRGLMDEDRFVPDDDSIFYFVNKATNLVERVDVYVHNKLREEYGYQYERYLFHNVKILESIPTFGDEWNINSPIYANTPKYNIYQHIPASLANIRTKEQYKVTDQQLLDYPLLDVNGDTVYIGQMRGWLLIDFFQYGCPPCAKFHKKIQDESKDNGMCILEKHGIQVVCIHPKTGLSDAFKHYVEKFGLQTRAYCARELAPLVGNLNYYPKYYLISPDKKIVLEDEKDPEIIIKKINDYEMSQGTGSVSR